MTKLFAFTSDPNSVRPNVRASALSLLAGAAANRQPPSVTSLFAFTSDPKSVRPNVATRRAAERDALLGSGARAWGGAGGR